MQLSRFFPLFCVLSALMTFGFALYDPYQIDGDAVAYMDLGDLLRAHHWSAIVNGYWHPLYPACLALGHFLCRSTRHTELHAYYLVNFAIFLLEMLSIVAFTDGIALLRRHLEPSAPEFLLGKYPLRYLGLTLLLIASQRELSLGKVRPDALLQALILFALAALLRHLASQHLRYAALMGTALGLAYLTKSFAFLLSLLTILTLVLFRRFAQRQPLPSIAAAAALALLCFSVISAPYIAALSHQKGRLTFGDSGALNYAWYVGGTEKMHLQPWMTSAFGSAEVRLKHPEQQLLRQPGVFSYRQLPYGTYPPWFDPTFWNDTLRPRNTFSGDFHRGARNLVLVLRYLLNHPEPLLLLGLLLLLGARFNLPARSHPNTPANIFWLPPLALGLAIWGIYGLVNIEERYVTVAYLSILLPTFAALRHPHSPQTSHTGQTPLKTALIGPPLVLLLALLTLGESTRLVLEDRRQLSVLGYPGGWYDRETFHAAAALTALGLHPGDSIGCIGDRACLHDHYWARLARVRIVTEIYVPPAAPPRDPFTILNTAANRDEVLAILRHQGDKLLVGYFEPATIPRPFPPDLPFQELGDTNFYALPLDLIPPPVRP